MEKGVFKRLTLTYFREVSTGVYHSLCALGRKLTGVGHIHLLLGLCLF